MAEISRFFDHIDGDRTYNANDFAEYFRQILTTGVLDTGDNLQVYADGIGRNVKIKPGKAWIEGYFYKLTEELELQLEEAHGTYDRIDRIVLRLDTTTDARNIKAFVKKGVPTTTPEPPVLTREGNVYEISLAQILVIHNTTFIPSENVTDERLNSLVCGLANIALTYEEFALKVDTGDINSETLPIELKGKPLTEQIMYVLEHAGKVKSVNGKTGEVTITYADVGAVPNTRKINAGTGLSGGGQLNLDRTFSVDFGTGYSQVARGSHVHSGYQTKLNVRIGSDSLTTSSSWSSWSTVTTASGILAFVSVEPNGVVLTIDMDSRDYHMIGEKGEIRGKIRSLPDSWFIDDDNYSVEIDTVDYGYGIRWRVIGENGVTDRTIRLAYTMI